MHVHGVSVRADGNYCNIIACSVTEIHMANRFVAGSEIECALYKMSPVLSAAEITYQLGHNGGAEACSVRACSAALACDAYLCDGPVDRTIVSCFTGQ